jgi:hypothetical protein
MMDDGRMLDDVFIPREKYGAARMFYEPMQFACTYGSIPSFQK